MYAGHIGIALGAKGLRREAPLWLLVLATQGCDWAQAVACVAAPAGTSAMWSHSIPAALALGAVLALVAYGGTRSPGVALLVGAVTLSHAVADYVTGMKPTWPGGPVIGLDMYDHPLGDFIIETAVVYAGWLVYRRSLPTAAPNGRRRRLTWALVVVLVGLQLAGAVDMAFFPPGPKCR
jgi:hypothetical protein